MELLQLICCFSSTPDKLKILQKVWHLTINPIRVSVSGKAFIGKSLPQTSPFNRNSSRLLQPKMSAYCKQCDGDLQRWRMLVEYIWYCENLSSSSERTGVLVDMLQTLDRFHWWWLLSKCIRMANTLEKRPHLLDKSHIPPSQYICPVTTQRPTTTSRPTSIIISSKIQKLEGCNSLRKTIITSNIHHSQLLHIWRVPSIQVPPSTSVRPRARVIQDPSPEWNDVPCHYPTRRPRSPSVYLSIPTGSPSTSANKNRGVSRTFFRTYCIYFKVFFGGSD